MLMSLTVELNMHGHADLMKLLSRGVLALTLLGSVAAPADEAPLRALVVTIVAEDGFLPWLTAPAVAAGELPALVLTTRHVRDFAAALDAADYDLVIAHAHARPVQRLAEQGRVSTGRAVFANPIALIGPAHDPAGLATAGDLDAAFARLAGHGACWLDNGQPELAPLTALARERGVDCVIVAPSANGAHAVVAAAARGAYTAWGLHPYTRLARDAERAHVIGDARLLRPLVARAVLASPRRQEAQAVIDWLADTAAQRRLQDFRLARDPRSQAFWPVAATAASAPAPAAAPGSGRGGRAGSMRRAPGVQADERPARTEGEMGQQREGQPLAQ